MEAMLSCFGTLAPGFLLPFCLPEEGSSRVHPGGGQEYRALTKKTTDKICLKDHEQAVRVRGRVGCSPTFGSCGDLHLADMWV